MHGGKRVQIKEIVVVVYLRVERNMAACSKDRIESTDDDLLYILGRLDGFMGQTIDTLCQTEVLRGAYMLGYVVHISGALAFLVSTL